MCRVLVCCESSGLIMCVKGAWVLRLPPRNKEEEEEEEEIEKNPQRLSWKLDFVSGHSRWLDFFPSDVLICLRVLSKCLIGLSL